MLDNIQFPDYNFNLELQEIPKNIAEWSVFVDTLNEELKLEKSPQDLLKLYEYLGVAHRILRKLDIAEVYLFKALSLATSLNLPKSVVQNQIRLAHTYQWRSEFYKSKAFFDQAKYLLNNLQEADLLIAAYHQHLGKYFFDQRLYGNAVCEFELALKMRIKYKAPAEQMSSSESALVESYRRWSVKINSSIKIRVALKSDAESIHNAHMKSIKEICSSDHTPEEIRVWGGRTYNPEIRIPAIETQYYLVVEQNDRIEGFAQLKIGFDEDVKTAYLYGFYITPQVLKKNIGHALMSIILDYCKSENVKTFSLKSTITAFDFYKRYGFQQDGEMSGVLRQGVLIRGYPMKLNLY
jgi:GNAT superfamily N-acetyltransferase